VRPIDASGARFPSAYAAFLKQFPQKNYREWILFLAGWISRSSAGYGPSDPVACSCDRFFSADPKFHRPDCAFRLWRTELPRTQEKP